jgi:hypothetical protein
MRRAPHTLLESQGYRITTNREFFNAPIPVAIDAILSAHAHSSAFLPATQSSEGNSQLIGQIDAAGDHQSEPLGRL